ncbi:MAG: hypothetical protein QNJ03_02805 [Dinoroseobacter sp.]|nr:hypothetical protein [Dinoroseobacter sp.]
MIWGFQLSYVGAVFAMIFTIGPKAMPASYGWALTVKCAGILLVASFGSAVLLPYPLVFLTAICLSVMFAYRTQLVSGDVLLTVFALISALLVPHLTLLSPDLASEIAFALMANLVFAMIIAWCAYIVFPEGEAEQAQTAPKPPPESYNVERRLARMALVVLPFVVVAFVFDFITPFVLIFVAIQSVQIVADTSVQRGLSQQTLFANAIGGLAAIVVYEAMVIVSLLPFALLSIFAVQLWFARRILAGDARLVSATTAFLILTGGTLMPFADDAQTKMLARLWHLVLAFAYLSAAFAVVDRLFAERTPSEAAKKAKQGF